MIGQVYLPKLKNWLQGVQNRNYRRKLSATNWDQISCGRIEQGVKSGHLFWSLLPQMTFPHGSSYCLGSRCLTRSCCRDSASTVPLSIILKQLEPYYVCVSHDWDFFLSMKLNDVLTIRPSQTHVHKNISSFFFSFLVNFISFSHKISKTCFLYMFVFLNVAFGKKATMCFHFVFIPRGNTAK